MTVQQVISALWPVVAPAALVGAALAASVHAILWKRDTRATVAWVGLIWLVPGLGPAIYFLLGINRIRRRAVVLHGGPRRTATHDPTGAAVSLEAVHARWGDHLAGLSRLAREVTRRPLLGANLVTPLVDGDAAYPAMLSAIDQARRSVTLLSFIFDDDPLGQRFVRALGEAVRRGVQVRVLVDGVGAKYSFPPIHWALRRADIPVARFLPTLAPTSVSFFNLRNHRKVLVVDGAIGFTGGMNIRAGHLLASEPSHPARDVHFQVEGPVVAQLQDAFAEDWAFATLEVLEGDVWFPALAPRGEALARVITDGPDDDFEVLRAVLLGALSSARQTVRVVTPYFLPDAGLVSALATCALRGVTVDLLLPRRGNLPPVDWACMAGLWQVLQPGCRVWRSPAPFDHSKLMVVDRTWLLLGSTNWDPRSLRLNFELNLEAYDPGVAGHVDDMIQERIATSEALSLAQVDGRPLLTRLRDGCARLFSPYL